MSLPPTETQHTGVVVMLRRWKTRPSVVQQHVSEFHFHRITLTLPPPCMLRLKPQGGWGTVTARGLALLTTLSLSLSLCLSITHSGSLALSNWSGDALSPPLFLSPSSLSLKALLFISYLYFSEPNAHTLANTLTWSTRTLMHKHTLFTNALVHTHWIFNLCPIFLPFWSSATTAAFPRRQVFSRFSTMGTEITRARTHTHMHSFSLPSGLGLL